jgi:hypothetical protein
MFSSHPQNPQVNEPSYTPMCKTLIVMHKAVDWNGQGIVVQFLTPKKDLPSLH